MGEVHISGIDLPPRCSRKLADLEIRGVRQLYARLQREHTALQQHLGLSDEDFDTLTRQVESVIRSEFPEDALPHVHPPVNKTGVAVNRLHDPARPRYPLRGRRSR